MACLSSLNSPCSLEHPTLTGPQEGSAFLSACHNLQKMQGRKDSAGMSADPESAGKDICLGT